MIKKRLILIPALVLVVATLGVVYATIVAPLRQQSNRLADLRRNIRDSERVKKQIKDAQRYVAHKQRCSLPDDPARATTLYQEWLLRSARSLQIDQLLVFPGRPITEDALGHRIPMTVKATLPMSRLASLLDMFEATPILHRVTHLSVDPVKHDAELDMREVTVELEAIALRGTEHATFPVQTTETKPSTRWRDMFARRDPFVPGHRKPKIETSLVSPAKTAADPLKSIRFVGVFSDRGQNQAWLVDSRSDQQFTISADDELELAERACRVVHIGRDFVDLNCNGKTERVDIGEDLGVLKGSSL